jgi:hypothetical protein
LKDQNKTFREDGELIILALCTSHCFKIWCDVSLSDQ